jgi:hypothetical protein
MNTDQWKWRMAESLWLLEKEDAFFGEEEDDGDRPESIAGPLPEADEP